jgi:hypothetical protein
MLRQDGRAVAIAPGACPRAVDAHDRLEAALAALSEAGWPDAEPEAAANKRDVPGLVRVAAEVRRAIAVQPSADAAARHLAIIARVAEGVRGRGPQAAPLR